MSVNTIFIVNDDIRKRIKALKKRAARNIVSLDQLKQMNNPYSSSSNSSSSSSSSFVVGDDPANSIIAGNHRIVFSFEEQPKGLFKHISISCISLIDKKVELPHPTVVSIILKEFGFKNINLQVDENNSNDFYLWKEAVNEGIEAINILERDAIGLEYLDKKT